MQNIKYIYFSFVTLFFTLLISFFFEYKIQSIVNISNEIQLNYNELQYTVMDSFDYINFNNAIREIKHSISKLRRVSSSEAINYNEVLSMLDTLKNDNILNWDSNKLTRIKVMLSLHYLLQGKIENYINGVRNILRVILLIESLIILSSLYLMYKKLDIIIEAIFTPLYNINNLPVKDRKLSLEGIIKADKCDNDILNLFKLIDKLISKSSLNNEQILSEMSHEIRTPLNSIKGNVNYLINNKPDTKISSLSDIKHSVDILLDTVNDYLLLSKINSPYINIKNSLFYVHEVFYDVELILKPLASEHQVTLMINYDNSLMKSLICTDFNYFRQILINISTNAIKYTKNKGNVDISLCKTNDRQFRVLIRNTGDGIDIDKINDIFTPYKQLQEDNYFGGVGLGLAISKKLSSLLKINISIESGNKYTTFILSLPEYFTPYITSNNKNIALNDKSKKHHNDFIKSFNSKYLLQSNSNKYNKKILIIDDDLLSQKLIDRIINNRFICKFINNGNNALYELGKSNYDLILIDLHMPKINGIATAKKIKNNTLTSRIPTISLSSKIIDNKDEFCRSNYFDDCLAKPFDFDELLSIISKY